MLLLESGASQCAVDEARRVFAAIESFALPEAWTAAITSGLALVREDEQARRGWAQALELIAKLRDASIDDPAVSEVGHWLAASASVGASERSQISFKDQASIAIAVALASCFSPAQVAAAVTAAIEIGVVT